MRRIAIVSTGGGMLCSFSAGCYAALAKEHKYLNPDFVIAGSGSAGGAFYYFGLTPTNETPSLKTLGIQ